MIAVTSGGLRYGARWIFRGLDLALVPGRCLAVLGPNGCGKTSLVRAMLGLQPLTEGARAAPRVIGYVPQAVGRRLGYAVLDVVAMGRVARRGLFAQPTGGDRRVAAAALAEVGLQALAGAAFDPLSGGEKQLVYLARALATEANTLVLDEPASALDLRNQDRFLQVVDRLRADGRHAILFTTHLPQHASAVADDALLLFGSEDRLHGPVDAVMTERHLSRLYGLPVRIVDLDAGARPARAALPLFARRST